MTRIAYVSTFPPRRCGIAQFTSDLRRATGERSQVHALVRPDADTHRPEAGVVSRIRDDDPAAYRRAARLIDASDVDVVSLQHEFGIYGGPDGSLVLELLDEIGTPVVATLHTVLRQPTTRQRAIIEAMARRVDALVVMSRTAKAILTASYGIETEIRVIPHGVPAHHPMDRAEVKRELGIGDRPMVLSFGLVGPGKGFEHAIEAMASVRDRLPDALYVVLGATHPDLLRSQGEAYRTSLEDLVRSLGLEGNVRFEDRFVGPLELDAWLAAADVFVTPYPNLEQIVSGTLAYALGAGRAVVSTPYSYAVEMLGQGGGVLVDPGSTASLAESLTSVLADYALQADLEAKALSAGDRMRWSEVGAMYRQLFRDVAPARDREATGVQSAEVVGA